MKNIKLLLYLVLFTTISFYSCKNMSSTQEQISQNGSLKKKVEQYATVRLTADLSVLSDNEKKMLPYLFKVADIMDELFWLQAYGNPQNILDSAKNEYTKKFIRLNYGPWERLNGNKSFIDSVGEKPPGANFYPVDMTVEEFKNFKAGDKKGLYTLLRRDDQGQLKTIPYHRAYKDQLEKASGLLREASELAEDEGLKKYLSERANAFVTDDYFPSDMSWMDMKDNTIDFVVGPIENYEDQLFGYKTAYEAFILIKDKEWSKKLEKYASMLPDLQQGLPVPDEYKKDVPGMNSDLNAYDVIYYAGDCNAGAKTIAINLPNDEKVQELKGSRRLQLKNAMKAKFDKILLPISENIIAPGQRPYITFDAFFENTMFHEVAHGLGIKNTITGKGTVREALKDRYSALEEGKADILGLYIVTKLHQKGEITHDLKENYVTFVAGLFRSIRFGTSSAHGKANLMRYNYFKEAGAFSRNEEGIYTVNFDSMREAMNSLTKLIIVQQGKGDYEAVVKLTDEMEVMDQELKSDLARINDENIPVDIIFEQGPEILDMK